jgi:hypothetical protein
MIVREPPSKNTARRSKANTGFFLPVELPPRDLVDAIALPTFSAVEAVESMEKIVSKANEIKKAEREEMIMNFIMGLLCMYP